MKSAKKTLLGEHDYLESNFFYLVFSLLLLLFCEQCARHVGVSSRLL